MQDAISPRLGDKILDSGFFFRAARLFLLILLVIMPWEAVTAAREIALAGAAVFMALHLWYCPGRPFRAGPVLWPLLFYAFMACLSLVWAVDPAYTLKELRAELLKGVVLFYTGLHFIDDDESLGHVWNSLLVGLALMVAAGIFIFFAFGGSLTSHVVRAGSLHNGYGGLSTYLVTVWPFLLFAARSIDLKSSRFCWPLFLLLFCLLVFMTYSRAAWLAILVETCLFLLILSRRRLRAAMIALLVFVVLAAGLFTLPGSRHGEKWHNLLNEPQKVGGTTGDLLTLWRFSYGEIKKNPWVGIGLGRHSFSKAFPEFRKAHQPLLWHAHNMFVDTALQLGVLGLLALVLLLGSVVARLWPRSPPDKSDHAAGFAAAGAIMVIGFAIRNMSDDFFADDSSLFLWLMMGLSLAARRLAGSGGDEHGKIRHV